MASTDAKPIAVKNAAYRVTFPIFDADGDLVTGATGLDSEVSKDGANFADCTNEATEIGVSSGMYFLDLTATEMNADTVAVIVKTTSAGAKTTPLTIYPAARGINDLAFPTTSGRSMDVDASGGVEVGSFQAGALTSAAFAAGAIDNAAVATDAIGSAELADSAITEIQTGLVTRRGTATAGGANTITLDAGASAVNDFYAGQQVVITSGTGAGQARLVTSYAGGTKIATVAQAWATNPDNTSVFALTPNRALVSSFVADAVNAAALASDAVTEIQAGLATAAAVTAVQADTDDIQARLPAALVGGRMSSQVGAMGNDVMTAAAAAADLTTELQAGLAPSATGAAVQADTDNIQTRLPAALVGGRMDASVGAMAADVLTAAAAAADFDAEVANAAAAAVAALTSPELPNAAAVSAASTFQQKLDYLFETFRHKVEQTGATQTLFKDDGATPLVSAATSDDGVTFTRGEFV
jgi:hypothetical protein